MRKPLASERPRRREANRGLIDTIGFDFGFPMSGSTPPTSDISVRSFAAAANGQMVPVSSSLSYCSVTPHEDVDLQRLIHDPASATPPVIASILPRLRIVLAAYLEKPHGKGSGGAILAFKKPADSRRIFSTHVEEHGEDFIFLASKDEDVADCHDAFYYELATLVVDRADEESTGQFYMLLREELRNEVRGEVDDESWKLKDQLLSRQADPAKNTKAFRAYAREAMIDTLTLYLHGLCCDLDVEAGPRQLPSRYLRRRLELLRALFPPPSGIAVFPEDLPRG
jgi:hypothetical protein